MYAVLLISLGLMSFSARLCAQDTESIGYEEIIQQLSRSRTKAEVPSTPLDPLEAVRIHTGFSVVNSYLTLNDAQTTQGFHRGFEASLGIDLFSPNWLAEGAIRRFGTATLEDSEVSLREFDIRLLYRPRLAGWIRARLGVGLASRYLDVKSPTGELQPANAGAGAGSITREYTTASSIGMVGLEGIIGNHVAVGVDVSYRSPMIDETIEESAADASFRMSLNF